MTAPVITYSHHELLGQGVHQLLVGLGVGIQLLPASHDGMDRRVFAEALPSRLRHSKTIEQPHFGVRLGRGGHRPIPGLPKPLTDQAVHAADVVVTMGCGDACPIYPGKRHEGLAAPRTRPASRRGGARHPRRDQQPRPAAPRRTRPSTRLVQDIAALTLACDLHDLRLALRSGPCSPRLPGVPTGQPPSLAIPLAIRSL